jgi:hypothetical protein
MESRIRSQDYGCTVDKFHAHITVRTRNDCIASVDLTASAETSDIAVLRRSGGAPSDRDNFAGFYSRSCGL